MIIRVLDLQEEESLSEKKVINLVAILNSKNRLIELGEGTKTRLLYRIVDQKSDDGRETVIFYKLEMTGVSKENAILRIDTTCIDDLKDLGESQCAGAFGQQFPPPGGPAEL